MNKVFTPKLLLLLFPLAVIVFALAAIFYRPSRPAPILVSADPAEGSTEASAALPVTLTFDSQVDKGLVQITSSPSVEWQLSQPSPNTIKAAPQQYLRASTKYSLNIQYQDELISSLTFTTGVGQGDAKFYQDSQLAMERDYPLATTFPYETALYRVVYSAPLTLKIALKSSAITEQEAVNQVKSLVRSKGGDVAAHEYQVIPASPTPTPVPSPVEYDEYGDEIIPTQTSDPLYY